MGLFGINSGINQGYEDNRAQLNRRPKMNLDLVSPDQISLSRRPIKEKTSSEEIENYKAKYQRLAKLRRTKNIFLMIGVLVTLVIGTYSFHLFLEYIADQDVIISTYQVNRTGI
jgi:hypothetical protein